MSLAFSPTSLCAPLRVNKKKEKLYQNMRITKKTWIVTTRSSNVSFSGATTLFVCVCVCVRVCVCACVCVCVCVSNVFELTSHPFIIFVRWSQALDLITWPTFVIRRESSYFHWPDLYKNKETRKNTRWSLASITSWILEEEEKKIVYQSRWVISNSVRCVNTDSKIGVCVCVCVCGLSLHCIRWVYLVEVAFLW